MTCTRPLGPEASEASAVQPPGESREEARRRNASRGIIANESDPRLAECVACDGSVQRKLSRRGRGNFGARSDVRLWPTVRVRDQTFMPVPHDGLILAEEASARDPERFPSAFVGSTTTATGECDGRLSSLRPHATAQLFSAERIWDSYGLLGLLK